LPENHLPATALLVAAALECHIGRVSLASVRNPDPPMRNAPTTGFFGVSLAVAASLPAQPGARWFAANVRERPKLAPGSRLEPCRRP